MFVSDNYFKKMEPKPAEVDVVAPSTESPSPSPASSVSSMDSAEVVNNNKRKRVEMDSEGMAHSTDNGRYPFQSGTLLGDWFSEKHQQEIIVKKFQKIVFS